MLKKMRVEAACCIIAIIAVLFSADMTEANAETLYLSQLVAADYVDIADYDEIPVEASRGDSEGVQNDIGEYLEKNSNFKKELPQAFVARNTKTLKGQLQSYADQYNISLAEFMKYYEGSLTEDTYEKYIENMGMTYSRKLIVLQAVADMENLGVTDDELKKQLQKQAELSGYTSVEEYEKVFGLDSEEFREMLMSQKVLKFLEDRAVYEVAEKK